MRIKEIKVVTGFLFTMLITAIIGFTACEKYNYDPPVYVPPDITQPYDTVYYGQDIAPLFPAYNCTDCHGGAISPNLKESESYESLTEGGYLNMESPVESTVIVKIDDPGHGGTWSTEDRTTLLDWIYQGAPDN